MLRAHLLFNCEQFSLCIHCKTKTSTKFWGFYKKLVDFQNFQKSNFVKGKYLKTLSSITLPWGHAMSSQNLGPIGPAVLTFIGYKQTNSQPKYI